MLSLTDDNYLLWLFIKVRQHICGWLQGHPATLHPQWWIGHKQWYNMDVDLTLGSTH